jgi:hypothetical protein
MPSLKTSEGHLPGAAGKGSCLSSPSSLLREPWWPLPFPKVTTSPREQLLEAAQLTLPGWWVIPFFLWVLLAVGLVAQGAEP